MKRDNYHRNFNLGKRLMHTPKGYYGTPKNPEWD